MSTRDSFFHSIRSFRFLTFVVLSFCLLCVIVFAEEMTTIPIPSVASALLYDSNSDFELSASHTLLYRTDRTQVYFALSNLDNESLNTTLNIICSSICDDSLIFDYQDIDLGSSQRIVSGIFIQTNSTKLGNYDYVLTVDNVSKELRVTVISEHFFEQFWYELMHLFG